MTMPGLSVFGEPVAHHIYVIYDPANGQILHTHEFVTYPNAKQTTEADAKASAFALLARKRGGNVSGLEILSVQPADYQQGTRYRVELPARRLVALS